MHNYINRVTYFPLIVTAAAISESREKLSRVDNCLEAPLCAVIIRSTFFPLFSRGTSPVIDAYWFLFHCGDSEKRQIKVNILALFFIVD